MKKIKLILLSLITISSFSVAFCAKAEIIFNSGFEEGDISHIDAQSGARITSLSAGVKDSNVVDSTKPHSGQYSIHVIQGGDVNIDSDNKAEIFFDLGAQYQEIYISWWIYYGDNYVIRSAANPNNNKLFYLWGNSYQYDEVFYGEEVMSDYMIGVKTGTTGYPDFAIACGKSATFFKSPPQTRYDIRNIIGKWANVEIHAKIDSGIGDGIFTMWVDGEKVMDYQNIHRLNMPCMTVGFFRHGYLLGWANSGFDEDTSIWVDDIKFSTTRINDTLSFTCNQFHFNLCTDQSSCENAGGSWCGEICRSDSCSTEIRADVNQDNQITSTDAMLTLRKSLNLDMSQTNWQDSVTTGDVNCDNTTNSTDAMLILRKSLGLDVENTGWCVS